MDLGTWLKGIFCKRRLAFEEVLSQLKQYLPEEYQYINPNFKKRIPKDAPKKTLGYYDEKTDTVHCPYLVKPLLAHEIGHAIFLNVYANGDIDKRQYGTDRLFPKTSKSARAALQKDEAILRQTLLMNTCFEIYPALCAQQFHDGFGPSYMMQPKEKRDQLEEHFMACVRKPFLLKKMLNYEAHNCGDDLNEAVEEISTIGHVYSEFIACAADAECKRIGFQAVSDLILGIAPANLDDEIRLQSDKYDPEKYLEYLINTFNGQLRNLFHLDS